MACFSPSPSPSQGANPCRFSYDCLTHGSFSQPNHAGALHGHNPTLDNASAVRLNPHAGDARPRDPPTSAHAPLSPSCAPFGYHLGIASPVLYLKGTETYGFRAARFRKVPEPRSRPHFTDIFVTHGNMLTSTSSKACLHASSSARRTLCYREDTPLWARLLTQCFRRTHCPSALSAPHPSVSELLHTHDSMATSRPTT